MAIGLIRHLHKYCIMIFSVERGSGGKSGESSMKNMKTKNEPAGAVAALSPELLRRLEAYWRAANYLSVGQIYLYDNPLLKEPLTLKHVKPRLLGHWGT